MLEIYAIQILLGALILLALAVVGILEVIDATKYFIRDEYRSYSLTNRFFRNRNMSAEGSAMGAYGWVMLAVIAISTIIPYVGLLSIIAFIWIVIAFLLKMKNLKEK